MNEASGDIVLRLGVTFLNGLLTVVADHYAVMKGSVLDIDNVQLEQLELSGLVRADLMGTSLGTRRCLIQGRQAADGLPDDEATARGDIVVWLRDSFLLDRVARGAMWYASTIGPVTLKWVEAQRLRASTRLRAALRLPGVPPAEVWICTGWPIEEIIGGTEFGQDSDVVVRFGSAHLSEVLGGILAHPSAIEGPIRLEDSRVEIRQGSLKARFDVCWWRLRSSCVTRLIPRMIEGRIQVETLEFAVSGFSLAGLPGFATRWVREYLNHRFERTISRKMDPWISRRLPPVMGDYVYEVTDVDSVDGGWAIFAAIRGLKDAASGAVD